MRHTLIALVAGSLVLVGCANDLQSLDSITVSDDSIPSVDVADGFASTATDFRVISEGSGQLLDYGDTVKLDYLAINGRTGQQFDNSYTSESPMLLTLNEQTTLPGFLKGLVGQRVGSRVLVAVAGVDGASLLHRASNLGLTDDDTMVFLFDIVDTTPETASGKTIELPDSIPQVVFHDGVPERLELTATSPKRLWSAAAYLAIEGEGEPLVAGQKVGVQYVGQQYPDGEVFESTWATGPRTVTIGRGKTAPCWDNLLLGVPVGSRVVLTCPEDFGDELAKSSLWPDSDVVFVIDLLDVI